MSSGRILVVDDEERIRRALRVALSGHGYAVDVAVDGPAAVSALAGGVHDAVVLDLVMPGMDGLAVLKEVRGWSEVPVVVLSARGQEADKVDALDHGADDYLTKPFGMPELLARLRAVMRRSRPEDEPVVVAGPLRIDLAKRIVTRDGTEVHLTPTEWDLLRVLAASPGKVLTHRQLLERAWGGYAADNSPQLRVYVNYLRRKLEADPTRPRLIVTEPGVGYRLKADG